MIWTCQRKGNPMTETESFLITAKKTLQGPIIWKRKLIIRNKTASVIYMDHIINECSKLAQKEYIYLPTPPLGQDMTQSQFLSEV